MGKDSSYYCWRRTEVVAEGRRELGWGLKRVANLAGAEARVFQLLARGLIVTRRNLIFYNSVL